VHHEGLVADEDPLGTGVKIDAVIQINPAPQVNIRRLTQADVIFHHREAIAVQNQTVSQGPQPDAAEVAARRGRLRYYLDAQSTSPARYLLEQTLFFFLRGIPSLVGVGLA